MAKRTKLVGAGEEIKDPRAPLFSLVTGLIITSLLLVGKWLSDWVYAAIRVSQWLPWLTGDGFSLVLLWIGAGLLWLFVLVFGAMTNRKLMLNDRCNACGLWFPRSEHRVVSCPHCHVPF